MRSATFLVFLTACAAFAQPPGLPPASSDDDAWAKLPPKAKNPALPVWARMLAEPLPKTTSRMLELDYLHRAENPLGPVLAAKIRWVVADAIGCKYAIASANADLVRTGIVLAGGQFKLAAELPKDEAAALAFARKLTRAGHTITDDEFAELLQHYGPEKTTAIVHTVAYANFHNRIVLGIGVPADSPPTPPVPVKFESDALAGTPAPARPSWDNLKTAKGEGPAVRIEWTAGNFNDLGQTLDEQKARKLRIPLPDPSRFETLAPREKDQAGNILWNAVSSGYQPLMTRAWFACLSAFYEESKVDRVFTNSMFWVITRTNDCFY